jgi:hypothetical protein
LLSFEDAWPRCKWMRKRCSIAENCIMFMYVYLGFYFDSACPMSKHFK